MGRDVSVAGGGAEEGRSSVDWACVWEMLSFDCISPVALASLFVNDEMAQPDQEVSIWRAPMRGAATLAIPLLGGGRTDSANEFPYLRVRRRYISNVLLA